MASYEKRGKNWRVQVRRKGVDRSATFPTKGQAVAWAAEQEAEILAEARGELPKRTLKQAIERYLEEVVPGKRGQKWEKVRLESFIRDYPALCAVRLADMTTPMWVEWRNNRLKELAYHKVTTVSPETVRREMGLLSSLFTQARKEWHWIHESPLADVQKPPKSAARTRRISADEIRRITLALGYEECRPVKTLSQQVAVGFLLAIETAMRDGELLALEWARITAKVAHLPKTKNGDARDVPLSSRARELLEKLRGIDETQVFTVTSASRDALFRKARDAAGVVGLRFHDSRREGTSRLSKKVDVLTLARITGHRDINELLTYYQTNMHDVADTLD